MRIHLDAIAVLRPKLAQQLTRQDLTRHSHVRALKRRRDARQRLGHGARLQWRRGSLSRLCLRRSNRRSSRQQVLFRQPPRLRHRLRIVAIGHLIGIQMGWPHSFVIGIQMGWPHSYVHLFLLLYRRQTGRA